MFQVLGYCVSNINLSDSPSIRSRWKLKILSYKDSSMIILEVTSIQAFNYIVLFLGCLMGIPYILWQSNGPLRSVSFFGKSFTTWDSQRVQHMAESYRIIWGSMIPAIFFATSLGSQVTMGFPPTFRTQKDNLSGETWTQSNKKMLVFCIYSRHLEIFWGGWKITSPQFPETSRWVSGALHLTKTKEQLAAPIRISCSKDLR